MPTFSNWSESLHTSTRPSWRPTRHQETAGCHPPWRYTRAKHVRQTYLFGYKFILGQDKLEYLVVSGRVSLKISYEGALNLNLSYLFVMIQCIQIYPNYLLLCLLCCLLQVPAAHQAPLAPGCVQQGTLLPLVLRAPADSRRSWIRVGWAQDYSHQLPQPVFGILQLLLLRLLPSSSLGGVQKYSDLHIICSVY